MENLINLKQLYAAEPLLEKRIFTSLQLNILKKKLRRQPLSRNEKTYYYKFIRPKVRAMFAFFGMEETIAQGKEWIIPERIAKSKQIIQQIKKKHKNAKILISGSFLFNQTYKDIDVFIFTKYQKEDYSRKEIHVNFLPESALYSLFFSSLCQISLSNFNSEGQKYFSFSLKEILQTYELLINEILNKEDYQKGLRDFLLQVEYLSKKIILNPLQLYTLRKKFSHHQVLSFLQRYLIENLSLNYSKKKLALLRIYLKDYKKLNREYTKSINLQNYIKTYEEVLKLAG